MNAPSTFLCRIIIILAVAAVFPSGAATNLACPVDSTTDLLLHCIRGLLVSLKNNEQLIDPATLSERMREPFLREPLEALAKNDEGYDGAQTDLEELKRASTTLKLADSEGNYESISILDNAIA